MYGIKEDNINKVNVDNSMINLQIPNKDIDLTNLPREEDKFKDINVFKEYLMFEYKDVSPCKFFFHFLGNFEKFIFILAIMFTVISGCSDAVKAYLIGDALNELGDTQEIEKLSGQEFETRMDSIEHKINRTINEFLIYGAIIYVFDCLSFFLWFYLESRIMYNYSTRYFSLILRQEQEWFDKMNTFELSTKVQAQLEGIEGTMEDSPRLIILFTITIISGFVVGFIKSWKLTLVLAACALPFIIACHIINTYGIEKQRILDLKTKERPAAIAEEIIYNIKTVASFANFDYEIQRYNDAFKGPGVSRFLNPGLVMELAMFGIFVGFTVTCIYARKFVENHSLKPGDVGTVLLSVRLSTFILYFLVPKYIPIKQSAVLSSDYFNLYERVPKIYISPTNLMPKRESIRGNIEFRNVKFGYNEGTNNKLILDGLNLSIEAGKIIAIIGKSGSGKTTTMSLLERIYDPIEGEILLDGKNVKDYNVEYLRNLVGYVQQDHFLFNKSIKDNIIFGRKNTIKEFGDINYLLDKACTDAQIKDFIEKKANKYEYIVGEKGKKLLPGYKQCTTIARAFVGQPRILILDEPTSELDYESEEQVMKVLNDLNKHNITIIILENKPNIVKYVDMIYILKNGKIVEQGNHEQLMNKNGYYTNLMKSQIRKNYSENYHYNSKFLDLRQLSSNYNNLKSETLRYQIGQTSEESIKFRACEIFKLISENKLDLIIGTIFALGFGAGLASIDFLVGKIGTKFALEDTGKMKKQVLKWSLILLLVVAIWVTCDYMTNWKFGGLGATVASKTRNNLLRKYLEMHVGFFDFEANSSAYLLSILSVDSDYLGLFFNGLYNNMCEAIGLVVMALILGFYYCWRITLVLIIFPFIRTFCVWLAGKFKNNSRKNYKQTLIEARSFFTECILNTKSIFSYNFQQEAINIYKNILKQNTSRYIRDSIIIGLCMAAINTLVYPASAVAYKAGIKFLRKRYISFDELIDTKRTLMSIIDGELYYRIRGLLDFYKVHIAYKYIYKILNTPSEINAFEYANKNKISAKELKGKIEFKNVTFSYPTKPSYYVLKNVSFIISPGERAAIVGNMETGKSTIIELIERFYDVFKGDILIDDINIKDYNLFELRKKIGLVKQEEVLFKRGIYENILYGNLNASKDEVILSSQKAKIHKLLNGTINIDQNITSEGEKQRISIARIFLKNPDILLLDNITSDLDPNTEEDIIENISEFQKGKTTIMITQRLKHIIDYDIILFMDKGNLIEQGTHNQLMELRGCYYNLYSSQM